jgi:hypothetical protein
LNIVFDDDAEERKKLEDESLEYFRKVNSETIANTSEQIRTLMLDLDRSGSNKGRLFKKLQKEQSVVNYSKFIADILWILYKCTTNRNFHNITDTAFMEKMAGLFSMFFVGFNDFHKLLFEICTQKNDLKAKRSEFALVKALIFKSYTSKNGFLPAEYLTPLIAKLEYAIRCAVIQEIMIQDEM